MLKTQIHPGFNQIDLDLGKTHCVEIDVPERTDANLLINVHGAGNVEVTLSVGESAHVKYLWLNQSNEAINVTERIELKKDAHLEANYGEMSRGNHTKKTTIDYQGTGSRCDFKAAIVAFDTVEWSIKADHNAKHSFAMVECNAIVLDEATLNLEVIGKISKGNSGSETHQMSRILNLGDPVHGIVYPMLLIDENDVAASHAASVGQPDEEHIYYLQSRGLSREDALKLMVMGYLMPIVDAIDETRIQEALREEIEQKVQNQW